MTTLTPAELAAHFRVSERTIARMVDEGCPSMLVGARRRFDLAAVTQWTAARGAQCQSAKTSKADGMRKHALAAADFTAAYRRAQLRVTPSA